jgi:hypothetical protein
MVQKNSYRGSVAVQFENQNKTAASPEFQDHWNDLFVADKYLVCGPARRMRATDA